MIDSMATEKTITLDEDVAARLADETQRTGTPVHEIVNAVLRRTLPSSTVEAKPFQVRPRKMGSMTGLNLDCTERLLNEIEGPNWK
jgi:hypothetical protein